MTPVTRQRERSAAVEFAMTGGTAAGLIAIGVGGGYWLGSTTGAGTLATLAGLGVGIVAAVITTYLKIKRYL